MTQGPDGMLWMATEEGLYKFNGMAFSLYEPPAGERWFSSSAMLQVYAAPDGTVWTSSRRRGLAAIRNGHVTFYDQHDGLPDAAVKEITQAPDGTMWVVGAGGRLMYLRSGRWLNEQGGLSVGEAVSLNFFDQHRTQWIATRKAVYCRSRGEALFRLVPSQMREGSDAVSFHETPEGKLLLALNYNLPQLHFEINEFTEGGDHALAEPVLTSQPGWFTELLFDHRGSTWLLGKNGGYFRRPQDFSGESSAPGNSQSREELFSSLPKLDLEVVETGLIDKQGDVWLASDDA
ncbi:MAG TPA: hypothetical protein VKV02_06115, partial [Acidobacteriaceae bacterium]|nr:hypothetical protein [Acidobacteriaceae bacterium]